MEKEEKEEKEEKVVEIVDDKKWDEYIANYESLEEENKKIFLEVFYQGLRDSFVSRDSSDTKSFREATKKILARFVQLDNLRKTLHSQNSKDSKDSKKATVAEYKLRRDAELKARQDRLTSLRESLGPSFA